MWHEARKQEKIIRGLIVDYRRRAERRRDFYEKIKADPTQFLQIHGRPCKIHLDPVIAAAGESPAIMMPWQGDQQTLIDRFDVRAHLDAHDIPDIKRPQNDEITHEERYCNYERYRILAQNSFLGVDEEKFLHQLNVEEQFGVTLEEKEFQKERAAEKKNAVGVAIGYNYDDNCQSFLEVQTAAYKDNKPSNDDSDEESDLEIVDVDLSIDVNKVETSQAHSMNSHGTKYGMLENDLFSFLTGDAEDAEKQKQILREEKEKALFSGRKSRRERRAHRDKKLALRVVSPPHYAARPSPTRGSADKSSPSPTKSASPEPASNTITFITSFGGDDEPPAVKMSYADKLKSNDRTYASVVRDGNRRTFGRSATPELPYARKRRTSTPPTSRSYNRSRKSRSRSKTKRSRSRSRPRPKRSRSKSRSKRSKSKSPIKPKSNRSRYVRSRSRSVSRKRKYSSSDRSSSRDSYRRRSYSRSSSKSRSRSRSSRSSSSSSSSSDSIRRTNSKSYSSHQKSSHVGPSSYNTDSNSGPVNKVPRYYGRKREGCRSSSSELSLNSDNDDKSNNTDKVNDNMAGRVSSQTSNVVRSSGSSPKRNKYSSEKLSLKEKLRRKMQAQLTRQLWADKKAEAERQERELQLLQERDEEMRELAIKLRRRQREIRHQRRSSQSSEDRSSTSSKRRAKSTDSDSSDGSQQKRVQSSPEEKSRNRHVDKKPERSEKQRDHRSRSRSKDRKSPHRKRARESDFDSSRKPKPLVDY